jgi:hypothetical protein
MRTLLLTVLAVGLLTGRTSAQPKSETPEPLRYTIRSEKGTRTSRDRDSALKTLEMTDDQVRAWVEAKDDKAAKEGRAASFYRSGYVEIISSGKSGQLEYIVRDRVGSRTCRDREAVLRTVKMTADQVKAWADAPEAKAEGRSFVADKFVRQITVRSDRASVTGADADSASAALKLTDEKLLEWVKDEKAAKEGRAVTFVKSGHLQVVWRGSAGQLLYGVVNSRGSRTSRERESVLKTVEMTEEQVRAWVADEKAAHEGRGTTFANSGYVELISRGNSEEPPR